MKTFRIVFIKDAGVIGIPGRSKLMIQAEQIITTDNDELNFEVPAGYYPAAVIEMLPAKHISKPDAVTRNLIN